MATRRSIATATAAFDFALASRTEVPAAKVAELVRCDPAALEREATSIREVEKHFVEILSNALEGSAGIGPRLRELDLKLFSQDHEWRHIMRSLIEQGPEYDDFKRVALAKYLQYLGSRQDILRSIYANKHSDRAVTPAPEPSGQEFKETGQHLTLDETTDWLDTWGTDDESGVPECHE